MNKKIVLFAVLGCDLCELKGTTVCISKVKLGIARKHMVDFFNIQKCL